MKKRTAKISRIRRLVWLAVAAATCLALSQLAVDHYYESGFRRHQALDAPALDRAHRIGAIKKAAVSVIRKDTALIWRGPVQPVILVAGTTPVIFKLSIAEPVVFLSIDDGWTKNPQVQQWLVERRLPLTLFVTNDAIKNNYDYFRSLQSANMTIQDHTLRHVNLTRLPLNRQKTEICATADIYQRQFGRRPTLLRPPYGDYNDKTIQAANQCAMRAIVLWTASVDKGVMNFQDDRTGLEPGDIVLMHFRSEFLQDMQAFLGQVQHDHLQIGRLEDWLQ